MQGKALEMLHLSFLQVGWSAPLGQGPPTSQEYWDFGDEMSIPNCTIGTSNQIIRLRSLRIETLSQE